MTVSASAPPLPGPPEPVSRLLTALERRTWPYSSLCATIDLLICYKVQHGSAYHAVPYVAALLPSDQTTAGCCITQMLAQAVPLHGMRGINHCRPL